MAALSNSFKKMLLLPRRLPHEFFPDDSRARGQIVVHTRHFGRFLDTSSSPSRRLCVLDSDGLLYIYMKEDLGFLVSPSLSCAFSTTLDFVRTPDGETRRCRIKMRFRFGVLYMVLVGDEEVGEWTAALSKATLPALAPRDNELEVSVVSEAEAPPPIQFPFVDPPADTNETTAEDDRHGLMENVLKGMMDTMKTAMDVEGVLDVSATFDLEVTTAEEPDCTVYSSSVSTLESLTSIETVETETITQFVSQRPPHRTAQVGVLVGPRPSHSAFHFVDPKLVNKSGFNTVRVTRTSVSTTTKSSSCPDLASARARPGRVTTMDRLLRAYLSRAAPSDAPPVEAEPAASFREAKKVFESGEGETPKEEAPLSALSDDDGLFSHVEDASLREGIVSVGQRRRQLEDKIKELRPVSSLRAKGITSPRSHLFGPSEGKEAD